MNWQNTWPKVATIEILHARAAMLAKIRQFFAQAQVLEVETPHCSNAATTDPAIYSMQTSFWGPGYPDGLTLYLHTSPEFAMKRLLASGVESIYQICKVYRNCELGKLHNPEFSLLEWYRPHFSYQQLMVEVATLINYVTKRNLSTQYLSYSELFHNYLQLDPHFSSIEQLTSKAVSVGIAGAQSLELPTVDAWLDLLLTHHIEPSLPKDTLVFIYDYPASQASLAQIRPGSPPLAERFELYLDGMELANGFQELRDVTEQYRRFNNDIIMRKKYDLPVVPMDKHLLAALEAGLPPCAGVALGLDRLLMWLVGAPSIDQVLTFPLARA
ncbi:hypothetical protein TI04_09335 [Achromatium sp. WMS2]|nr:hypothetical protein TI04_09335 [Achromatium sp. WMS2]